MRRLLIFTLLLFTLNPLFQQQMLPGGVKGPSVWSVSGSADAKLNKFYQRVNMLPDSLPEITGKAVTLNNNPAVLIANDNKARYFTYDLREMRNFTLFTVCGQIDTLSEKAIFSMENDTGIQVVLTNKRLAAVSSYKYSNFIVSPDQLPRIYTYVQNSGNDTANKPGNLRIGQPPRSRQLPIRPFSGVVPEIILFNRTLSYTDKLKVESYLALKYGINLGGLFPVNYTSSNGTVIWDAQLNAAYSNNIAGIGRDDISGLDQTVSESLQTPGLMKISVENGALANNSFVVWGDNNAWPVFGSRNSLPKCLGRDWKICATNAPAVTLNCDMDILSLPEIRPLLPGETLWLMVDNTGSGLYPYQKTTFIKGESVASSSNLVRFNNFVFAAENPTNAVFTVIAMPRLFTRSLINRPNCGDINDGKIQTEIVGGTPPYTLKLKNTGNLGQTIIKKVEGNYVAFDNISQGLYTLEITDSYNSLYSEDLRVTNNHQWDNGIAPVYTIAEGSSILLDASQGMPAEGYTYLWTFPGGKTDISKSIVVDNPGEYLLSVTGTDQCTVISSIQVRQVLSSAIEKVDIFPNPVTNGYFTARVSLRGERDIHITLVDSNGKVLEETTRRNSSFYWYNGYIARPGVYFLTISAQNSKETLKIIVQ